MNPDIKVIVDLCLKHNVSPEELCAKISLNPIPPELTRLGNNRERAAVFAAVNAELIRLKKEQDRINEAAAIVPEKSDGDFYQKLLKPGTLQECFFQWLDNLVLANKGPEWIDLQPVEIYDLTVEEHSKMGAAVNAWFDWIPAEKDIRDFFDTARRTSLSPWRLHQERNIGHHFPHLDPVQIKRLAYECMKRAPNTPEWSGVDVQFDHSFKTVLDGLKQVSMKHAECVSEIKSILDSIQAACLGPVNGEFSVNQVYLIIELGTVKLHYLKRDWTFANTADLKHINSSLKCLIMGDLTQWLKGRMSSDS